MSEFGRLFRVMTFGESHGGGVGCIVEGVPPRMALSENDIQSQLDRRRPGQSHLTTARKEADKVTILSGTEFGITLGTPIAMVVKNEDQRPGDYGSMADIPRPSHADYTYQAKYGVRASSGGGRASARETIGRVAAGAIAEKWLSEAYAIEIVAWVSSVGTIDAPKELESSAITKADVDNAAPVRCPHPATAAAMESYITQLKNDHDSTGGIITCICRNIPSGWGEPAFDKLEALLAHAMMSIPSTKAFEIGSGFSGVRMKGSEHNDLFQSCDATNTHGASQGLLTNRVDHLSSLCHLSTATNRSGGIQGGISNGESIIMRIGFKPPATILRPQHTADFKGTESVLKAEGRHDPCVLPRAIPIVEAMAALVLADMALQQEARMAASSIYPILSKVTPHDAQRLKDEKTKAVADAINNRSSTTASAPSSSSTHSEAKSSNHSHSD